MVSNDDCCFLLGLQVKMKEKWLEVRMTLLGRSRRGGSLREVKMNDWEELSSYSSGPTRGCGLMGEASPYCSAMYLGTQSRVENKH